MFNSFTDIAVGIFLWKCFCHLLLLIHY